LSESFIGRKILLHSIALTALYKVRGPWANVGSLHLALESFR
jgi:hypothetical protein